MLIADIVMRPMATIDPAALTRAAAAAGCSVAAFPTEGRTHTTGRVRYRTNPPTSDRSV